ncbi:MAG: carboxypeptidase regulatory-like domain-containing protein [Candidatus Sulfotelmatobacter sp.]
MTIPKGRYTMLNLNSSHAGTRFSLVLLLVAFSLFLSFPAFAQTTVATGSIVGTITDPSNAVVEGAKVTITNVDTNEVITLTSNSSGAFNSGALTPGHYKVQVSAKGFNSLSQILNVQVGNTATVNAKLQLGQESQVIEVQGSAVTVNTEQATVQGVVTASQVENLPINGRNFLDLAQLEPGVQIQDGQNFDPTKAGYSSISFGGRFGRTARINVDGIDISDETVGTTTADIPASAIAEFQLSQSSLDLSQDLTSSGAVNVTTKSGTNAVHGEAFGLFRDNTVGGASSPGGANLPTQRSQFGGSVGGPVIRDKAFFFLDGERTKQDSLSPVLFTSPFNLLTGGFSQAFRESNLLGKADYNLGHNAHLFYRYTYFANFLPADFGFGYSVYANKDYTRVHAFGADFNTGSFTHSIRFSYLKFQNQIADITTGSSLPLANTGVEINGAGSPLYVGPNLLAPQSTPQSNHELKYDGSRAIHSHIVRYGISFNHIQGGGFASFFGVAPRVSFQVTPANIAFAAAGPYPELVAGDPNLKADNPLNYPTSRVRYGNGLGFSTTAPALGFPAGGLGPDNRLGIYFGDNWKIRPNFTLSYGLRWDHDTGRTDSDLGADPTINAAFPGWGNKVNNPNKNFAPQVGFAWDPAGNGKTVVRGGVGLFYENIIYNNVLFDRPLRLQTGAFNQTPYACGSGGYTGIPAAVPVSSGTITPPASSCGNDVRIGDAIPSILAFWNQYKAGNPVDITSPNPNYIGNFLGAGLGVPLGVIAPNYKTPVSVQMNIGIQRQIRQGMVLSVDYLRNVETHSLLGPDLNHVGDVKNFNLANAQAAIATTNASFGGCATVDCAILAGATMADYAGNGLTADSDFGQACNQAIGVNCAFPGVNPNQAAALFLQPIGRSVYNAMQVKLVDNVTSPIRGVKALNFQLSYSLSRFENSGGAQVAGTAGDNDQDFVLQSADNNVPNRYFGPALLDRTHQISLGGYADLPAGFRFGLTTHFGSPQATALDVPNSNLGAGEIFRTDFTGDGTIGDPMPGTHFGQFDRGTNASNINALISNYNTNVAGQATPAGQVLITNGLMTLSQLQALQGVAQPILAAPANQVNFSWLRALDMRVAWRHTFAERFTIEPSVGIFNLFNFANFNLPPNTMSGILTGSPGAINGTTPGTGTCNPNDPMACGNNAFRVGNGTGVYAVGAPRQVEWGVRVTF